MADQYNEKKESPSSSSVGSPKHEHTEYAPHHESTASHMLEKIPTPAPQVAAETAGEAGLTTTKSAVSESDVQYPSGLKLALIMAALCLAVFLVALDRLIIVTAIPKITDRFNSLDDVGWYGSAYLLTMCAFQLSYGKIYKYFSLKWTFLSAVAVFEIGSLVCAAAPSSTAFIVGRAIAGLGCAGIFSGALIINAYSVPMRKRPAYFGLFTAMFGLAGVLGPLLGGAFSNSPSLTWRWCFWINLPIGGAAMAVIVFFFKSPAREESTVSLREKLLNMDPLGVAALLPAVICLLLALQWGGSKYPWSDGRIIALLVLFSVLTVAFIATQIWLKEMATIPPRIFLNRTVFLGFWYTVAMMGAYLIIAYYMPVYFQAIKGVSPLTSGIRSFPLSLAIITAAIISGSLTTAIGLFNPWLILGPIIASIGIGLLTTLQVDSGQAKWVGYQFITGFGVGLSFQLPVTATQNALGMKDVAIGSSMMAFAQALGGAIFISAGQNVLSDKLISGISKNIPNIPDAATLVLNTGAVNLRSVFANIDGGRDLDTVIRVYNSAVTYTFWIALGLVLATFLMSFFFPWIRIKKQRKKVEDAPEAGKTGEKADEKV